MRDFLHSVGKVMENDYNSILESMVGSGRRCGFFYPFCNWQQDGRAALEGLRDWGLRVTCVCALDGVFVDVPEDVELVYLSEAVHGRRLDVDVMFMLRGNWQRAFSRCFERQGITTIALANGDFMKGIRSAFLQHLPELYDSYALLRDSESRSAFRAAMEGLSSSRYADFCHASEPQYMLHGFLPCEGDTAIDGGAYDGATSRDFASLGAKVYAFELDSCNSRRAQEKVKGYDVVLENKGLWSEESEECYAPEGVGSKIAVGGSEAAHLIDVDTYVERMRISRVDYIKLDVEGAEMRVLKGAAKSIAKWKPKMALSAYHKTEDLWLLTAYVKSLRPDYEFAFRHYCIDVHDYWTTEADRAVMKRYGLELLVPSEFEMVLYCR